MFLKKNTYNYIDNKKVPKMSPKNNITPITKSPKAHSYIENKYVTNTVLHLQRYTHT